MNRIQTKESKMAQAKVELVKQMTDNYENILDVADMRQNHPSLDWGSNGVGNRFCNKKHNYSVIQANGKTKLYSENDDDEIPEDKLSQFLEKYKSGGNGIIGIFIHSERQNIEKRPIGPAIKAYFKGKSCVVCGSTNEMVVDHSNDLYNDPRVLDSKTQEIADFQPLCGHCNLQKRQVCKKERETKTLYHGNNIPRIAAIIKQYNLPSVFPWEPTVFDETNVDCKKGTYWYDPIEFELRVTDYLRSL